MPTELKFLNSREAREILSLIKEQWGCGLYEEGFLDRFSIMKNKKGNLFIISKDIARIINPKLKIDSAGLYFAEMKNNSIRLSIEGSQIVGRGAGRNIIDLSGAECAAWMKGEEIPVDEKRSEGLSGYLLVRFEKKFLGSGRLKEGNLLNFVPKVRRIKEMW
ncbi:hypothetical protein COV21_02865 [Candidatus Woesearchaeota archaeon CG10_big_fil_rev_8_21_14_0_10_45_5]|nr:MAG: hypothetical protein COV21_02865 [Candidatus Woesearchaeota archaeon CG10_big_fil_rev_8_21_14_0_10_45_5]PIU30357.1 MAG: hypothetical protein COT07_01145 [Candidatus Woesearchaeota archaeon CG07_land_8_20_14_0_80_44_23]